MTIYTLSSRTITLTVNMHIKTLLASHNYTSASHLCMTILVMSLSNISAYLLQQNHLNKMITA